MSDEPEVVTFHVRAIQYGYDYQSDEFDTIEAALAHADYHAGEGLSAGQEIWDSAGQRIYDHGEAMEQLWIITKRDDALLLKAMGDT